MASNVLPHKDRISINDLSSAANGTGKRPPINSRDASVRAVWKNQTATAIPVPVQGQRRLTDPYTPAAFTANPTASQTLTAGRQGKRKPPTRIDPQKSSTFVTGRHVKSKGKQKAALAPQYDVVDVDNDEDLGQPLSLSATRRHPSPDQLDCFQRQNPFHKPTELESQVRLPLIHPFEESDEPNAPSSSKTPQNSRYHAQPSSSPIEEFQPSPPPARPLSTSGRVRGMVSEINAQNQSIAPHVDLKKEEKSKAKARMRPKGRLFIQIERPQHPHIQVKKAFVGLHEYEQGQISFQYSSDELILTTHGEPPKSLVFALDRIQALTKMSNHEAKKPFLRFATYPPVFGFSGRRRQEFPQFKEGDKDLGRVLLLFEDDQPDVKGKILSLVEVVRKFSNGAEYVDAFAAQAIFEMEMSFREASKMRLSSSGLEDSQTRRRVSATTKPISGVKRKITDEDQAAEVAPLGPPRKRSTYPSEDASIKDVKPRAEAVGSRRRSARQIQMADDPPRQPQLDPDEIILVYPPNTTGAVTIKNSDLDRLQPGEFLNDTLIEFGLKLWLKDLEESHPELAKDVYVFSSFFYKKLKVRNLHWYLAIIYEPEHILLPPVAVPPRLTRKMGRRKATEPPVNNTVLSKIPQTPEEDLAERTNEMLISPRSRSKTPSELQEVEDQLEPESEDEMVGGGPPDSPLTDMEDLESVHGSGGRARSLSASETGSRHMLLEEDISMSGDEPSVKPQSLIESDFNDIITDETLSAEPSPPLANALSVVQFYGKSSKGPTPKYTTPPVIRDVDGQRNVDVSPDVQMGEPQPPRTYIFTLDSLGTRHTAVYKTLNTYLKLEAKDKKDFDLTSEGVGVQALVPYQPNHCDCGVYLLHFAQTFMKDPGAYCNIIKHRRGALYDLRQRQIDWDDALVGDYREKLAARIKELSLAWKRDKGAKNPDAQEAQAEPSTRASSSKTSPEVDVVADSEDSDESIEIVELGPVPSTRGKAKGTKPKGRSQASRLRG
ncbi:hypothetical protein EYR40_009549 [Pleurotus pulmonarius]|nr:hypothetical protein EYR40_009549 [Pleurotus pulmonarius]